MSKTDIQQSDVRVADMVSALIYFDPNSRLTSKYIKALGDMGTAASSYVSQKDRMYYTLAGQLGSDPGMHAAYDGLKNPLSLLWLAEVLGETSTKLKAAMDAALVSENDSVQKICDAFREAIPYMRIKYLFESPKSWRIDPSLDKFLGNEKRRGMPAIAKDAKDDFRRALKEEGICFDNKPTNPLSPPVKKATLVEKHTKPKDAVPVAVPIKKRRKTITFASIKKDLEAGSKADIHVRAMYHFMSFLQPHPPITTELDCWGCDYPSQKGHMIGWFDVQPVGTGHKAKAFSYQRQTGNTSSRTAYNRFLNPGGLLWVAEAFGESEEPLRKAVEASLAAEKINFRSRCAAFRKVIPFDRIVELLNNPSGWLYDPNVLPMLEIDEESGLPDLKAAFKGSPEYRRMIRYELSYVPNDSKKEKR